MNRAELDVGDYRHKSIWDKMADQYNNNTGIHAANASDGNKGDNSYLDVIQTPHMLFESLMKAELSQDVLSESSVPGLPATTAQLQETMHGFHTPRAKPIKHKGALWTFNTKEETDNAILRYIASSAARAKHNRVRHCKCIQYCCEG